MNADGSEVTQLTTDLAQAPAWSPNGNLIAFSSNRDGSNFHIFVMNADGSAQTQLTPSGSPADFAPSWSPDGKRIAFMTNRDVPFFFQVYVMNADGTNPTNVTNDLSRRHRFPDWGQGRYEEPTP